MNTFSYRTLGRLDWRALLVFGWPLVIYIATLAPTIYNLDSAELVTAAATRGLVRATGYPLYLLLGQLWAKVPVGDVGYRLNLFSAFCGALTLFLADRVLRRFRVNGWAAVGALGLLATAPYFWGLSLVAEVYTLHSAIMAGFILALLWWAENPAPLRLGVVGLLAGLGLAHHLAMSLLLPGAAFYLLSTSPRKALAPKTLLLALAGLVAGLSPYLDLPLRYMGQPAFNYAGSYNAALQFQPVNLLSLDGLWWLVTGRAFSGQMFGYSAGELWLETRHFIAQLSQAFFAVGLGPGILGLVVLVRRDPRQAILLSSMFVVNAAFYINYRVVDKDTMFMPTYLIWGLWVGIGYQALLSWLPGSAQPGSWRWSRPVFRGLILGAVILALIWNWRLVDLSQDWSTRRRGESILRQVAPNAIVFGWWDTVPVVQYLQLVEGKRPDVLAVNRFLISPADLSRALEREVNLRPIYIDSSPIQSDLDLQLLRAGPIYRLVQQPHWVEPGGSPRLPGRSQR